MAEICFQELLKVNEKDCNALHKLAFFCKERGDFVTEEFYYTTIIKYHSDDPEALANLAYFRLKKGQMGEAC
jgi:Flp pilus assembly protein TadD